MGKIMGRLELSMLLYCGNCHRFCCGIKSHHASVTSNGFLEKSYGLQAMRTWLEMSHTRPAVGKLGVVPLRF